MLPGDRLDDDRGEALGVLGDGERGAVEVVEPADDGARRDRGRDTGARRDAERGETRAGADEHRVGVAVVAAGELDHAVAARRRAREPHRAHRRLGAGGDEAHHLHRRHRVDDLGGQLDLGLGRGAEGGAARERVLDRGERLGVGVTEDQRPPRLHPVDVAVAVDVLDRRALAAAHEQRLVEPHRPSSPAPAS